MNEIILNVISCVVTAVVIPLITLLGTKLISWLSAKIKNEKATKILSDANAIIMSAVKSTFQTYVDALKKEGNFNKEAQLIALSKAKDTALGELSEETKNYIEENYGDLDSWLTTSIESTIDTLKNG